MLSFVTFHKGVADGPAIELIDRCTATGCYELLERRNLPFYIQQYVIINSLLHAQANAHLMVHIHITPKCK